jgi:hypothetical protein
MLIDAIKTLRANVLAAREERAVILAADWTGRAPEKSRALTAASPRGYQAVISAIESGETDGLGEDILDAAWEAAEACQGFGWDCAATDRFVTLTASL